MPFKYFGMLLLFMISSELSGQGFGHSKPLTDWYFHLGDVRLGGRQSLNHSNWQKVSVPHDWTVEQFASPHLASATGYLPGGIGWYRTNLDVPATESGKRKYLYFEGVYNNSEVFINGNWLGKRPSGYASFLYDITPYVKPGRENVVAVKVDHSEDADSRWYTGSGIYRDVFVVTAGDIHIDLWGSFYHTKIEENGKAHVNIQTTIRSHAKVANDLEVKYRLVDAQGKEVSSGTESFTLESKNTGEVTHQLVVDDPSLWSLQSPYLYQLQTEIVSGGMVLDRSETTVGIRQISFDPDKGFALNNQPMKIKGVCLHHDAGVLGAAVPKEVWRERVGKLKEIGVNAIRMSHNPHAPDLYELCDELGLLVMDEAFDEWEYPKKKWLKGWNVGKPGFQGYAKYFREWGKRDLSSMVLRDRNHPSIIMWSIGNEVDYPNDPYSHPILEKEGIGQYHVSGYQTDQPHADRLGYIANELADIVRQLDSSRPVTAALAGAVMSNETTYPAALNVVGYNYTESRYDVDHECYPERILYGSETRHNLSAWKSVRDKDHIFGQFVWTGFDYLGEAHRWPSRGFTTGMIDQANNIKPIGYFRKSLWTEKPMVYLGTYRKPKRGLGLSISAAHRWNYTKGETIRVVAYTNCEEAELRLNGKLVGKRKPYDDNTGMIYWDVSYKAGKLTVTAYKNGKKRVTDQVQTTFAPVGIQATLEGVSPKKKGDVTMIELTLLDKNGSIANLADNIISCKITGPAKLLGLENASYNAAENFNTNRLRAKNGKLLAYIQSTDSEGEITVLFNSPYLVEAKLTINLSD